MSSVNSLIPSPPESRAQEHLCCADTPGERVEKPPLCAPGWGGGDKDSGTDFLILVCSLCARRCPGGTLWGTPASNKATKVQRNPLFLKKRAGRDQVAAAGTNARAHALSFVGFGVFVHLSSRGSRSCPVTTVLF